MGASLESGGNPCRGAEESKAKFKKKHSGKEKKQ
jgi:hypothetical protein